MTEVYDDIVLDALEELANGDYQREVWTGEGESNEVSSFTECVCRLFDDSCLGFVLESPSSPAAYSPEIDRKLVQLSDVITRMNANRSPEAISADPQLIRVRLLAADILHDIRLLKLE
jgi:hypothetical protein